MTGGRKRRAGGVWTTKPRETPLNPAGRVAGNSRKEGVLAASRNMSTKGTKVAKRKNYHTASVLALGQLGRRALWQRDPVGENGRLKWWKPGAGWLKCIPSARDCA